MWNTLPAIVTFVLAISVSVPLLAQDTPPEADDNATGYKLAAGVSYTVLQGKEAAFKAKYFLDRDKALEAQAGLVTMTDKNIDLYQVYLSFIWQPHLPGMGLLSPYVGAGPAANKLYAYPANPGAIGEIAYFGVILYGLEYSFATVPVAVSLDCKIPFVKLNKDQLRWQSNYNSALGAGVKFLLH